MNNEQSKSSTCDQSISAPPLINCEGKVIDLKPKTKTERAQDIKKSSEIKLNNLVIGFLGEAKDDSLGNDFYYNKYKILWKKYVHNVNNTQKLIVIHLDAFEKRVEFLMDQAKKQLEEQNAKIQSETTGEENQTPSE